MKVKDRKLTEKECINSGGHFWKHWSANTPVDPNTFEPDFSCGSYAVYYPNGEPQYRGCPLCGRIEILNPAQWTEYVKGKNNKEE